MTLKLSNSPGLGAVIAAALLACAAFAEPHTRPYSVVNDGVYEISSIQVRVGGNWSDNLLAEPVRPGQTVQLRVPDDGRPCLVDLAVNTPDRGMNAFLFDENICARPQFHVAAQIDPMDAPGSGRRPPRARTGAVRGGEIERGLPLCPGDARCRGKPGG
jgi:hypothetical protein